MALHQALPDRTQRVLARVAGGRRQGIVDQGHQRRAAIGQPAALRKLEQESRERDCAQLFIETPYRNQQMLAVLRQTLKPATLLTVACDLTLPTQTIISRQVKDWPTPGPDLHKRPAIFVLYAGE